jgi:hypothetical protein
MSDGAKKKVQDVGDEENAFFTRLVETHVVAKKLKFTKFDVIDIFLVKRERAIGGCLGIDRRRRTCYLRKASGNRKRF